MRFQRAPHLRRRKRTNKPAVQSAHLACEWLEERQMLSASTLGELEPRIPIVEETAGLSGVVGIGATSISVADARQQDSGTVFFHPDRLVVDFFGAANADGTTGPHSVLNPANWQLLKDGVDVSHLIAEISYEQQALDLGKFGGALGPISSKVTLSLSQALGPGKYELVARDSIRSADGKPLNDNDVELTFHVSGSLATAPEAQIGRAFNGQAPSVAVDAAGNYVAVWIGKRPGAADDDPIQVLAQRFSADGQTIGGVIVVGDGDLLAHVSVARSGGGGFVVAWDAVDNPAFLHKVFARRFDASGVALDEAFEVAADGWDAQVAIDAQGSFIVAYQTRSGLGYIQRYNAAGQAQGDPIFLGSVSQVRTGMDADGNFVAAWQDTSTSTGVIHVQLFAADGSPRGNPTQVSSNTGYASFPALAVDTSGSFVLAWQFNDQSATSARIMARRFDASGQPLGPAIQASDTAAEDYATRPAVAVDAAGNFVVGWTVAKIVVYANISGGLPRQIWRAAAYGRAFNSNGMPQDDSFRIERASDHVSGSFLRNSSVGIAGLALTSSGKLITSWTQGALAPRTRPYGYELRVQDRSYTDNRIADAFVQQLALPVVNVPEPDQALIVGRQIFYNNSSFDGHDPAAGASDDAAIATNKIPLRYGHPCQSHQLHARHQRHHDRPGRHARTDFRG